ncbi:flagellar motor stator protein MotA [Endozoicomonadaceae bacterium StTr2]
MLLIIGVVLVAVSIMGGFVVAGGKLLALWQPAEYAIIMGCAAGSFLVGNSKTVLILTWQQTIRVLKGKHSSREAYQKTLTLLYLLFETGRKSGLAALEGHVENPDESELFNESGVIKNRRLTNFICDNMRLLGLGKVQAHELEGLLESEIETLADDLGRPAHSLHKLADSFPGFGIIAAVLGIVITMQKMGGPAELIGVSIAAALVGTFIGILLGYGVFGPLAQAVEHVVEDDVRMFECVKTALVAHASGRPSSIAVDAGRRVLFSEVRPSFEEMENWLLESREQN